ncbi:MAG TPA: hypothetical protein VLS89_09255, partial [Candidatus Nanopelagicales bacterium]|nr:hypothetical protein [Candidatus Nanopelagicales bacterium]
GQRDQIELLRRGQSRWVALSGGQREASVRFEAAAKEAAEHRASLLRFFDLRFRNNPEGQRRVSAIREGNGDPDLVQDVSDVLVLCSEHQAAVNAGPKGEGAAADRLAELSPALVRLLADKTLSPEVAAARRARDAVYTMVVHTERRIRDAAAYWYGGTERMKEYAAYPTHVGRGSAGAGEDEGDSAADEAEEAAPV